MPKCPPDCACGRHTSYVRTPEQRAAISARRKGVVHRSLVERFWSKVPQAGPDECWVWAGAVEVHGYGKLYVGRNANGTAMFVKAHRLSWEIANGKSIPDGPYVLHSCDNPPCVNPRHLRLGDHQENMDDRAERKRGKDSRGEANDNAKLAEGQVRAIIAELQRVPRRSQASIAEQFGIKQPQVSRIMRRESWAHLWDE